MIHVRLLCSVIVTPLPLFGGGWGGGGGISV